MEAGQEGAGLRASVEAPEGLLGQEGGIRMPLDGLVEWCQHCSYRAAGRELQTVDLRVERLCRQ